MTDDELDDLQMLLRAAELRNLRTNVYRVGRYKQVFLLDGDGEAVAILLGVGVRVTRAEFFQTAVEDVPRLIATIRELREALAGKLPGVVDAELAQTAEISRLKKQVAAAQNGLEYLDGFLEQFADTEIIKGLIEMWFSDFTNPDGVKLVEAGNE